MRVSTERTGATPWWAKRRIQGGALALALLVGGGAAAQASSNGDGFLNPNGYSSHSTTRVATTNSGSWTWNGTDYVWQGGIWAWHGDGANRLAFRTIANRTDPTFNQLLGINDHGVIVGYFGSGDAATHPNRGFRLGAPYRQTSFLGENFPGSVQTQAVALNDAGVSVGFYVDTKGANHGYVFTHGHFRTVDFPRTTARPTFNQLLGINRFGIAVGFFNDAQGNAHGFLFNTRNGQFTLIRLPVTATSIVPTGINDHGQIVGFFVQGKKTRGFIWGPHQFTVLNLGNHTNTQALGINNFGVVVGSFVDFAGRTHGFIRVNEHLVRTIDVPGSTSTTINGLNNQGQAVGYYTDRAKNTLGFIAHR